MPVLDGVKFACRQCIIGHRTGKCNHSDGRELFPIRGRGRPRTQCSTCQERRRTESWHSKCRCNEQENQVKRASFDAVDGAVAGPSRDATLSHPSASTSASTSPCACKSTGVCPCCGTGTAAASGTAKKTVHVHPSASRPFGDASASSGFNVELAQPGSSKAVQTTSCCDSSRCVCDPRTSPQRDCCASGKCGHSQTWDGGELSSAIEAARRQGYVISTGPQPRRVRKDRSPHEQRRRSEGYGSGGVSGAAGPSSSTTGSSCLKETDPALDEASNTFGFGAPPPYGQPHRQGSAVPTPTDTRRRVSFDPSMPEARPELPSHLHASATPASALHPLGTAHLAPSEYSMARPVLRTTSAAGLPGTATSRAAPGQTLAYAPQTSMLASAAVPPVSEPPKMDVLLEAIKVIREGPESIVCTCKGLCRCRSCAGRARRYSSGGDSEGVSDTSGGQVGCCGSGKRSAATRSSSTRAMSLLSDAGGTPEADAPCAKRPRRFLVTSHEDEYDEPSSSAPEYATCGSSKDVDTTASTPEGDCTTCAACDLDFKMPSGIPAVDEFASKLNTDMGISSRLPLEGGAHGSLVGVP